MKQPLLVLDCHYLCHRAFHSEQRELSFDGLATGVIFGFLQSITVLKDEFQTDRVAFCFEHPISFRKQLFAGYKAKRLAKERTPEEQRAYTSLIFQIGELRQRYLPLIGFKNIFCYRGMESDDIMAVLAASGEEVILVTADKDLLQCLRPTVTIYNPQKQSLIDEGTFFQTFLIKPRQWAVMKALAGCHSDSVPGIPGVGEVTALKYLRGELKPESKAYRSIRSPAGRTIVRRNRPLVELPFAGCPEPTLVEDCVTSQSWQNVCASLGMRSIAGRAPVATRKRVRP